MRIVETNEALAAFLGRTVGRALSGAGHRIPARPDLLSQALPDPGGGAGRCRRRSSIPWRPGIDLAPFYDLLKRPDIVKVLHAARQDIEIFFLQGGVLPDPLFDSQIAAMVCGFGDAASYETLARKLAHVEIDKSARFTDWSHRPLSKRQLEYALADVTHLRVIYEKLSAQLARTGRAAWVEEEIAALQDPALYRLDPGTGLEAAEAAHQQQEVSGHAGRAGRLARARSPGARHSPRPGAEGRSPDRNRRPSAGKRRSAGAHPRRAQRLRQFQAGQGPDGSDRSGPRRAAAGRRRRQRAARRKREPSPAAIDLLKTLLRLRAEAADVAPRLIANAEDIEKLAAHEDDGVAALHGWRAEVFGNDAKLLRKGDLAIALENGEAVVVELEEEA